MPQLIACIECNKRIRVPDDMLGKRIKCPNCGATFVADEPATVTAAPQGGPASALEFDDEPAPRSRSAVVEIPRDRDTWGPVLTGVNLQLIAHFLYVAGSLLLALTLFILLVRDDPRKPGEFFDRFLGNCATVSFVLLLLNWLLSLAAAGCLSTSPARHGARGWAIACLALAALVFYFQYAGLRTAFFGIVPFGGERIPGPPVQRGGVVGAGIAFMLASLPEMVRLFILPFFLRAVGRNNNDSGLANLALYTAFAAPLMYGLSFALDLLLNLIAEETSGTRSKDEEQSLALIMLFLHSMALLLVLLVNILVLFRARSTVQKAARP